MCKTMKQYSYWKEEWANISVRAKDANETLCDHIKTFKCCVAKSKFCIKLIRKIIFGFCVCWTQQTGLSVGGGMCSVKLGSFSPRLPLNIFWVSQWLKKPCPGHENECCTGTSVHCISDAALLILWACLAGSPSPSPLVLNSTLNAFFNKNVKLHTKDTQCEFGRITWWKPFFLLILFFF